MTLSKKMEDNANLILWCVQVSGPDEVHAAKTYQDAVERAAVMNDAFDMHIGDKENDVLLFAHAAPWPWSKDDHAADMEKTAAENAARLSPKEPKT